VDRVAALVGPAADFRLLAPFRPGQPLTLERSAEGARARSSGQPVAEGPQRRPGAGLRIFPGRAADGTLAHCDARGHATAGTLWGAADCPALRSSRSSRASHTW
jgi:hypothetical protein